MRIQYKNTFFLHVLGIHREVKPILSPSQLINFNFLVLAGWPAVKLWPVGPHLKETSAPDMISPHPLVLIYSQTLHSIDGVGGSGGGLRVVGV